MGAFFSNIQLKVSELDQLQQIDNVVNYIISLNNEDGFIIVDDENEADKSVIISPSKDLTWISIFDEDAEDQDIRKLNKIAASLSKKFQTSVLSVMVNDSDSVYVGINTNGTLKDSISNRYKKIDFNKNKPSVWTNILIDNYSFEDIKNAWQANSVFVEDFLTQFAKFISLDTSKLLTGYEYLDREDLVKKIKLNFARKDKKKTEELGLTKFCWIAGFEFVDVKNDEIQTREWIITNQGDSSTGIEIIITGECIEKGLLIPTVVQVKSLKSQNNTENKFSASFIETFSTDGKKILYAIFDGFVIPKGYSPTFPMTPKESKRYGKIRYESAFTCYITFTAGNEGIGEFEIFCCPLINRQEGSCYLISKKRQLKDYTMK